MGCFIGTLIGSLPGIGPINGVAILLPLAYALGLPPESALILLAGVYYGAEYGGRISSILLNVPGDAGAIMTTLDGYPLSRKGEGGRALALSAVSSFAGSMGALLLMVFTAPLLSQLAIKFGPSEYVWLMVFAFTCLATMVGSRPVKNVGRGGYWLAFSDGRDRFRYRRITFYNGYPEFLRWYRLFSGCYWDVCYQRGVCSSRILGT